MSTKASSIVTSPLNDQQLSVLQQAISDLSPQQSVWVSGYLWGLSQSHNSDSFEPLIQDSLAVSTGNASKQLTVIYASQTGNAKGIASNIKDKATNLGIPVEVISADNIKGKRLAKESYVIFIASTHGEGEPPDDAIELHEYLQSKKTPRLSDLQFAVLALGDSSYEFFCQTGKDFDGFLSRLGATQLMECLECDVDYLSAANEWCDRLLSKLQAAFNIHGSPSPASTASSPVNHSAIAYTKLNPFEATLLSNQKITGRDSSKDVRHIELDLENSGLTYEPGDSLGLWYENDPLLVEEILTQVGLTGDELIEVDDVMLSLKVALATRYEITASHPQLVTDYAQLSGSKRLAKFSEDKSKLRDYSGKTQLIDVLTVKSTRLSAQQLTGLLRRISPRLYSIASSQAEVDEEVHLTLGLVEYEHGESTRLGGASGYLAQRLNEGDKLKIFVEPNRHFKLPDNNNAPIIMIGPGTGVAPFRSFIQERDNRSAQGKNWLIFGDRSFTSDFFYQVEWQKLIKSGVLSRIDLAFSRDQLDKIYVQDRLLEHAELVWEWIQNGAYLYVCGDASHMAKGVNDALLLIIEQQGKQSPEQAQLYLKELRQAKRYQRDVY